ncbi:type I-F CRISPR-associated protein Csy1 [Pantoea coffeiphila]|uniref:type I-F CRISPR-associated protein Csy1 n=1 Tax=Pantoea coffeiphila TaxID=1465635 RepID=UPI00195F952B|nr:type I-F CRISPR-associated protein Csy1 [Pantoea coffeiphila]MBM7344703.1 CRISPR-associated protein Csy1 [Pantoea coffeiphila]
MLQETLASFITDYINERKTAKLELFEKEEKKQLSALSEQGEAASVVQDLNQQRAEIEKKYQLKAWLTDAASRAGQISLVTHALKFTHSDARGSSVFSGEATTSTSYLSTATLGKPTLDAVGNAAALDIAKLLQTEVQGDSLIASLNRGDYSALESLTDDRELSDVWIEGFKQVLIDKQPASHKLAKQIYFPIAPQHYHLISPLFSSSLAHVLHQRIADARFSEEAKNARAAKKAKTWHSEAVVDFPATAVTNFGGTKPQNISYLNSVRRGRVWLLPCLPPAWRAVIKPPSKNQSLFSYSEFSRQAWPVILRMKRYLHQVQPLDSTMEIRQQRLAFTDEIIDILFNYAAGIQNLTQFSGWSADPECRLKQSQRLWLDPLRSKTDRQFQLEREKGDWKQEIARDFGLWLNHQLRDETLRLGAVEHRNFSASPLLNKRLRELEDDLAEDLP